MQGKIDSNFVPRVDEVYVIGKNGPIALQAVLDTGFNDEFCLPRQYHAACDLVFYGTDKYTLANGQNILEPLYRGEIIIDNRAVKVIMSLTDDDEALIGTRLLAGKIVTLDFVNYRISTLAA